MEIIFVKEYPQPEGSPRCFNFCFKYSHGKRAYKYDLEARLLVDVPREWYSTPAGAKVGVYGFFSDGRMIVNFYDHGYSTLPASSIEIVSMRDLVLEEEVKDLWERCVSREEVDV